MSRPSWIISSETALVLFALTVPSIGEAASCCAGSAAAPSLISGDERAQVSLQTSRASVIGDAPAEGIPVFRSSRDSEITRTIRVEASALLSDRLQLGASVPVVERSIFRSGTGSAATRLGDARLNFAYETMPEWTYSAWKPKGYTFLQLILPTGRSIHESSLPGAADATGRGYFTAAFGSLFVKRWSRWDAFAIPEIHYSFARRFTPPGNAEPYEVVPGWGGGIALGFGWNTDAIRAGLRIQPVYEQPRSVVAASASSRTSHQLTWDTGVDLSYLVDESWTVSCAYSDQTVLGPAVNSTLSRTISVSLLRRWLR